MEILDRRLSDIVTTIPGAPALLRQLDIDFCSGGQLSLSQVVSSKGLDAGQLVDALKQLQSSEQDSPVNWTEQPRTRLISHILERYHARHREQLPALMFLAAKVERVHARAAGCPQGLTELLRDISHELESHMMKEEQILFPMLAGGIYPNGPINVMQDEHIEHLQMINRLFSLTNNMKAPTGACNSWRTLYQNLEEFTDDLMQHITLENYFLFTPEEISENTSCCGSCQ